MIRCAASNHFSVNGLPGLRINPTNFLALIAILSAMAVIPGCGGSSASVNIQPAGTQVTVSFADSAPVAVAEQVGTGAWASVALPSSGQLTITVPSGTTNFAFAYVCAPYQGIGLASTSNDEIVIEAAISDGPTYTENCASNITTGTAPQCHRPNRNREIAIPFQRSPRIRQPAR
jgi:hypothetical protein